MEIKKKIGPYLVEVWETNKGHTLGLFKWRISEWESQTETYITIAKHTRFQTWDAAVVEAFLAIPDNPKGYTYPEFMEKYFPNDVTEEDSSSYVLDDKYFEWLISQFHRVAKMHEVEQYREPYDVSLQSYHNGEQTAFQRAISSYRILVRDNNESE